MIMVTSFGALILIGGVLLSLPKSMSPELRDETGVYEAQRVLNCFFTSTSAACVTGLVVYDTGADFSRFGQCVILGLIQIGGLGIMIFGTLFGVLAGRNMSLRHSLTLQDSISHETIGHLRRTVRFILIITFGCELVGAVLLFPMWPAEAMSLEERLFASGFHAISAFCNAGFALQADSLVGYATAWPVYISIMPLIVVGGLGFPVLSDILGWIRHKVSNRTGPMAWLIPGDGPKRRRGRPYRFSLHSKIVLASTALLIVLPVPFLVLFETAPEWRSRGQIEESRLRAESEGSQATMIDQPIGKRLLGAVFQSVTTRTAGFNTVNLDTSSMSPASRFLMCLLMFIGGSPGSTAGGVKTAAFSVLFLGVVSTLKHRQNVECAGRTIPLTVLRKASVVVVVMFLVVSLTALALCYTESVGLPEVLFESVSACGTVGLSTGLTGRLTVAGRIIIMAAMFAGRLGPLTLLVALAGREQSARYEYPEEQPIIG
jgi:trk system potassium uptake protein TrkH